jgi:peptidoglycan/LPS O-acetylase OafA/YrhL
MADGGRGTKFQLIQALRGLAALWVVLFHMDKGQYISGLTDRLGGQIHWVLFGYGSAGVAIFFVLSGFVISHSLTDKAFWWKDFVRFVIRRSVRLDPPYWAAMALSVLVTALVALIKHDSYVLPTITDIIAHLLYLQVVTGSSEINIVFWTLTYEIQFYIVLALSACVYTSLIRVIKSHKIVHFVVNTPLLALALAAGGNYLNWIPNGLFPPLWHGFFLGVLAYQAGYLKESPLILLLLVAVTFYGAVHNEVVFGAPAALTAVGLFVASRTGYLIHGLSGRGFQLLGTVSYSLYLIHVPVIHVAFALWGRLAGRGTFADGLGLTIVLCGTLGAAALFWWMFELPSHKLAAKLFRGQKTAPHTL